VCVAPHSPIDPLTNPSLPPSLPPSLQPDAIFRGVIEVVETVERLVDVGCITKADLVSEFR